MDNLEPKSTITKQNFSAVNRGIDEVALKARLPIEELKGRLVLQKIKIAGLLLLSVGIFLILISIALYIGRGSLAGRYESAVFRTEYIKVPDPNLSKIVEKTVIIEKPTFIPQSVTEDAGVETRYTIFRSIKQKWHANAKVVTGLKYINSKQKFPESQYCYVGVFDGEQRIEKTITLANKMKTGDIVKKEISKDQLANIGISDQNPTSLIEDCRFLTGGDTANSDISTTDLPNTKVPIESEISSGTGFFINKEGYVLTNNHVVANCDFISLKIGNEFSHLRLIDTDVIRDLAVLKASSALNGAHLAFADKVETGQDVYAFGFPFQDRLSDEIKVTNGIVSALSGIDNDRSRMQITNALQPGNSGGPLSDVYGQVVGINVSGLRGEAFQNINFAIKRQSRLRFLSKNKIAFTLGDSASEMETVEIAKLMKESVFPLFCLTTAD